MNHTKMNGVNGVSTNGIGAAGAAYADPHAVPNGETSAEPRDLNEDIRRIRARIRETEPRQDASVSSNAPPPAPSAWVPPLRSDPPSALDVSLDLFQTLVPYVSALLTLTEQQKEARKLRRHERKERREVRAFEKEKELARLQSAERIAQIQATSVVQASELLAKAMHNGGRST